MRVGRRSGDAGRAATATRAEVIYTGTELVPSPHGRGRTVATSGSHGPVTAAQPFVVEADAASLLPGAHTMRRRISFALVNACTLASLGLGLTAIFLAMQGDVRIAAACLVACVGFDGLDGALARRLGVSSPFGAQMDSLADMCSFGLAAPVVVYASLAGSVSTAAAMVACALVAACAAIRLARFNVSPKDGRFFCGVPTTMAAAVLSLAVLIGLPVSGTVHQISELDPSKIVPDFERVIDPKYRTKAPKAKADPKAATEITLLIPHADDVYLVLPQGEAPTLGKSAAQTVARAGGRLSGLIHTHFE